MSRLAVNAVVLSALAAATGCGAEEPVTLPASGTAYRAPTSSSASKHGSSATNSTPPSA